MRISLYRLYFPTWLLLAITLISLPVRPGATPDLTPLQFREDFDLLWKTIDEDYAYFDRQTTDWQKARDVFRPECSTIQTRAEFVTLLERLLDQLCDFHTQLNTNTDVSQRLIPSGVNVWAEMRQGHAIISEVRPGSPAARSCLQPGDEIVAINGAPMAKAIASRFGPAMRTVSDTVREYILMCLLAGRHDQQVTVEVIGSDRQARHAIVAEPDALPSPPSQATAPLEAHLLPGNIGYIRLHNSLGDSATISAFDAAIEQLKVTSGLLLDLRDTPGGGNTTVARGIMGRLTRRELPYQKHVYPAEEKQTGIRHAWLELVSPRGRFTYTQPVVVLVDHWTGSMGEGIAIGLDGMRRATVVGTRMAGLLGAKYSVTLPNTHIVASYGAEKVYHLYGTPREQYRPVIEVDLTLGRNKSLPDAILTRGLARLKQERAR
ncbi:MAG TPA: S41 family peptidase [Chthonomonadaceae bacterium]|nr:S41 family peptidase [Chthonomonadaceae bacterium]